MFVVRGVCVVDKVAPIWFLIDYPISDISVLIPIRYSSISLTLGKVRSLRFLEKKAGAEVL